MTRYVWRDDKWVEKHLAPPRNASGNFVRGVITDSIPDLVHPANGRRYDSKSAFRSVTRAHGYEEVGTEKQTDKRRPTSQQEVSKAVGQAIDMLRQGYKPHEHSGNYSGDGWQ